MRNIFTVILTLLPVFLLGADVMLKPKVAIFPPTYFGQYSAQEFVITNGTSEDINTCKVGFIGISRNEFTTNGACNYKTITAGDSCTFEVRFVPASNGTKEAKVDICYEDTAFHHLYGLVSNIEDAKSQAKRRIPPVIYSLTHPADMTEDQSFHIEWALMGYHDEYESMVVFFDCNGITDGTCGDSYSSNIHHSSMMSPASTATSDWTYSGETARLFSYSYDYTPDTNTTGDRTFVIRFYRINDNDAKAGKNSISALIPGNLNTTYYEDAGRRISLPFYEQ